ncbi:hypothetical protein [Streptomyces fulvoviolaceus]|uniref:hypothetical protein n=1 Tax=Streptomyces fulvoviolaceus TaxID=285535 RepID=UPI0004CC169F|nr:hypothetical protein [Streptomyces fulvoviolaceus]MCT9079276.1 hypothetical protein [Streptomyces fulvoviolaceus]
MFGVKRSFTHVAMVMGLTALITLTVLLGNQLNLPFSGLLAVDALSCAPVLPGRVALDDMPPR